MREESQSNNGPSSCRVTGRCGPRTFAAALLICVATSNACAQVTASGCGSLAASFGPFDYRPDHYNAGPGDNTPYASRLQLVEGAHFTAPVEHLLRGATTSLPGGDIEYTLRVWPNHHRALAAITRLWERTRNPMPAGMSRPVECYFERALRFQAGDVVARLLYVNFLLKGNRKAEAIQQLEIALTYAGDSAFTHYNIGVLYADAEMYDLALKQAHRALDLGFPRRALAERLAAVGHWKEPPSPTVAEPMTPHLSDSAQSDESSPGIRR